MKFNIELSVEDFVSLVGPSNLTKDKGGYAFIMPVNWIKLIETPIAVYERDLNGSLDLSDQLSLNKGRYYPESKRSKHFLVMYLKCKKCNDLVYNVVIVRKPETNESIVLSVERNVEHDLIRHSLPSAIRGDKRILLAKEVLLNHQGSVKAYVQSEFGKDENAKPPSENVVKKALYDYRITLKA